MTMNPNKLRHLIDKMMKLILPSEVDEIEYELKPTGDKDEYYMSVVYVVNSDSPFLRRNNMRMSDVFRQKLNRELTENIENYLNVNVIISNSGIKDKEYHQSFKKEDNQLQESRINLRNNIKQILREEVAKRFEKPSPNMEKLIYSWLDKYVSNSQMYQEKSWESRTDFTWCKDGKEIMQVVLFFNTDDTVYDDKRKTEERDFEEGSLWIPKDVVKSMLSYLPVRQNYLNYLIEEWFEDKFGSEINTKMNRDDIFIHEFKAYPDTASVCVPPMEKPEDVTEEDMIELILKTTLFKRDVLLRREEEEPGFIEKTYLQKIRNKKREELEKGN